MAIPVATKLLLCGAALVAAGNAGASTGSSGSLRGKEQNVTMLFDISASDDQSFHSSPQQNSWSPFDPMAGFDESSYVIAAERLDNFPVTSHQSMIFLIFGILLVLGIGASATSNPNRAREVFRQVSGLLPAVVACVAFMIVGPALITLNKDILSRLKFSYPLTLCGLGLFTSAVMSHLLVKCGLANMRDESMDILRGSNFFKVALPIGVCRAVTLATGNAVYLYLGLSFIQMLKALCPVFVLVAMKSVGVATPSKNAIGCVLIIVFGTLLEVKGEMHATIVGLVLMFISEATEAFNWVLTQLCLQEKRLTVIEGLYALTPIASFSIFALAAVLEWPTLWAQDGLSIVAANPGHFLWAGTLGFFVNFLSFLVVQHTSSLTCKILNTLRSIALVFIGFVYYGEECTFLELLGYTIAFAGFCGYSYVQVTEAAAADSERKALCKNTEGPTSDQAGATYTK